MEYESGEQNKTLNTSHGRNKANVMTIEEIPSDELVTMTDFWHRAFNAAGCDPGCHCCGKKLPVGDQFKLASVKKREPISTNYPETLRNAISTYDQITETREVMLCDICTPELFQKRDIASLFRRIKEHENRPASQGCFRINGKIIH